MSLAAQQQIRVLHVDDEPDFADLTGTFLEREEDRFTVETATSADDGLEIINDRPPDCVVSDYNMPGMDGLEFLQAVREDNPDLPFILYTGKGSEAVASEAISLGVTDYLQKGSGTGRYELLANRISNAVEQHRAKRRVESSHQAMDTANEGLSLVRPDGAFSYVNPAFAHLFEYEPDELIGEHWTVLYHNEEAERLDNDILPAVIEHGYWSGETVRLTKQGDRLVTDHRLARTAEDVIVCTARDITPERTGSTGQSSEFDFLVDTMEGHAFYTLDHEGYVTSWNEGAERLTGYSATEILGAHVGQFFTEEDRDCGHPEELIETAKADGAVTDQGWRVRNDDSQIRTADTISASYDATGTLRGFGVMMRESTGDPIAAELHRKTDYLDVIMEDSVQPLFMKNASGEYLLANREFKQLYDMQEETVIGRTDYDLHPEEMAEQLWASDRHVLETEEPIETEERAIVDGEEQMYLFSKVPIYFADSSDDPDAVFGMATDITERKERERELKRERRRYTTLFETLPNPVLHARIEDGEPVVQTVNPAFEDTFGYDAETIRDEPIHDYVLPDDRTEATDRLNRQVLTEGEVQTEVQRETTEGVRTFRLDVRTRNTESGDYEGYAVYTDITERKEREEERERQYEAIFNQTYQFIGLMEPDGTLIEANEPALEWGGLDHEDVIGKQFWNTYWWQIDDETQRELREAIDRAADGEFVRYDVEVRGEDENTVIDFSIRPVTDEDGEVTSLIPEGRDISELRSLRDREQELEDQNERLEEFASIVSHDLRNPLTVAEGHLELVEETCESDHLGQVADAIDRSQALIDDLLALAREGDRVDETEPVGLAEVAERSWQTVETRQATLDADAAQVIEADRSRLQQLLENLYRNAIEHGGDDLAVSVGAMDDGFYVADTGPGIPESDREEVFEAGYSTNEDGTGFGLRIVEQVANAHGWEITVNESEQGGARFEVTDVQFADR